MNSYVARSLEAVAFDPELTHDMMIFLAGPRQSGKTSLARRWLSQHGSADLYFNWDDARTRAAWRKDPHFFEPAARASGATPPWIALDEIHKASRWRDMLKGWFDVYRGQFRFLVTGSARLDLFRKGGDSLLGRHALFHLFPLSFREFCGRSTPSEPPDWALGPPRHLPSWDALGHSARRMAQYRTRGPFPEPLLADSDRFSRRWAQDYLSLLLRRDLRDLTRIMEIDRVETLVELLPSAVGSLLSEAAMGRQLEVAHTSVKVWLEALRRLYLVFPLRPYAKNLRRALRKGRKWYFLDWSHVPEGPSRLENLVASALWQACHSWTDAGHGRFELCYLRTLDKREIDFVILKDGRPTCAVEVKEGDLNASPTLRRRTEYLGDGVTGIQVIAPPDIARPVERGLWVVSVDRFLGQLT